MQEGPRYPPRFGIRAMRFGGISDGEEWNARNANLGETRPRGPVSPRPGMPVEQRPTPAIPTDLEPASRLPKSFSVQRNGNGSNASLGETRPRGPVSPRPGMPVKQRPAPAIPTDLEPAWRLPKSFSVQRNGNGSNASLERDSPTWPGLSETGNARQTTPHPGNSYRSRTGIETSQKLLSPTQWKRFECESRRDSPTWPGLSETGNARRTTPHPGNSYRSRTGIETSQKLLSPTQWKRFECESRKRLAHVARSLRDRECPSNNAPPRQFLPISNRHRDFPKASQSNAMETVRMRVSKETRPRGPVSPRPGMPVKQRPAPAIPTDLEPAWRLPKSFSVQRNGNGSNASLERDSPTWPGLSETGNARQTTPHPGNSYRSRTGIETSQKLLSPTQWKRFECESRRDSPT